MSLKNSTLNDSSILSVDPHAHSLNNTALFKEHEAVKSGYVFKRYKTRKIWKKRWMVTRGQSVFVYKNDKEYELLYHIDLSEVQAISEVNRKKKENVFGMVTLAKIFYFQALNQKEMEEWIQILKAARVNTLCQETEVAAVSRSEPIDIPSNKSSVTQPWPSSNSRPISFDPTSLSASSCSNMGSYDAFVHDSSNPRARMSDISLEAASEENSDFSLEDSPILQSSPITPDLSPPQLEMANLALESQANEPETGPRYQGFLSKKCESYKSWRTRWFVIRDGKLCYYKDDKEYEIHGMIPLQSISKVTKAISTDKSKKYCFKIISPKRNFKLCANTQADMEKWIDALNNRGATEFGSQAVAST